MALFGLLGGKKTSVGLDIGSGIIKLVVIDHSGSEPELAKVATTKVAADAIVEGAVMDPGIVAEAIRGLFSTAGVKQKSVGTAGGRRHGVVIEIPKEPNHRRDARRTSSSAGAVAMPVGRAHDEPH